jgi:hypothetical protein
LQKWQQKRLKTAGARFFVGWAKQSVPTLGRSYSVGTLCFAHPTINRPYRNIHAAFEAKMPEEAHEISGLA